MKALTTAALCLLTGVLFAMPAGFIDDYAAAQKKAASEKKNILAVFSGSDWCIWCQRLDGEVLSKKAFTSAVSSKFVLLFVDFPQDKNLVSDKVRAQNEKLQKQFACKGFPTVYLLSPEGAELGRTGYRAGGPEAYAQHILTLAERAPLITRHIEPLKKRFDGLMRALNDEFSAELRKLPKQENQEAQDAAVKKTARKLVPGHVKRLEAFRAEVESITVPDAVSEEFNDFKARVSQTIAAIKRLTDESGSEND